MNAATEGAQPMDARTRRLLLAALLLMLASCLSAGIMLYQGMKSKSGKAAVAGGGGGGGGGGGPSAALRTSQFVPPGPQVDPCAHGCGPRGFLRGRSPEDALFDAHPTSAGPRGGGETAPPLPEAPLVLALGPDTPPGSFGEGAGGVADDPAHGLPSNVDPGPQFHDTNGPPSPQGGGGGGFIPPVLPPAPTGGLPTLPNPSLPPVTPVPEPQTWLMLCAAPLVAWWARRRRAG